MSARLGLIPLSTVSWKGKTLYQVISSIQLNNFDPSLNGMTTSQIRDQIFRPLPLKIYRKEVGFRNPSSCNPRVSTKIMDLDMPGSTMVSEISPFSDISGAQYGLVSTFGEKFTTLTAENPGKCLSPCILSPEQNARRRCRSAGMIPKKFNVDRNNDQYCTSTNQYLVSRNRTIKQNEYNYIRRGNSGVEPGTGLSKSNVYSPGGLSHCYQPQISASNQNNTFSYIWLDGNTYTITIPDGQYSIETLALAFQQEMVANTHYFTYNDGKYFLINFGYNNITNQVILINNGIDVLQSTYPSPEYVPGSSVWFNTIPTTGPGVSTGFIILNNGFQDIIGFIQGSYNGDNSLSNYHPAIASNYVTLYYKPSNPEFGVQGGVDSSSVTQRRRYNTINNVASATGGVFGQATANAMAYGVSETPYSLKQTTGYRNTSAPIIKPNGQLCKDPKFIYRY